MKYRDLLLFLDNETDRAEQRRDEALTTDDFSESLKQTTVAYAMQRVKLWATAQQLLNRPIPLPNAAKDERILK
jgi:hypothetical protein